MKAINSVTSAGRELSFQKKYLEKIYMAHGPLYLSKSPVSKSTP